MNEQHFSIEEPKIEDALGIAKAHIQAWKDAYIVPETDLTEEKIDAMFAHFLTDLSFRENTIKEAAEHPDKTVYRIVRNEAGVIVGFMHGTRRETYVELDAIYLVEEVKGTGVAQQLMDIFFEWAGDAQSFRLEVFTFNPRAIRFYEKYGFAKTDTSLDLFRGLPRMEMVKRG